MSLVPLCGGKPCLFSVLVARQAGATPAPRATGGEQRAVLQLSVFIAQVETAVAPQTCACPPCHSSQHSLDAACQLCSCSLHTPVSLLTALPFLHCRCVKPEEEGQSPCIPEDWEDR